MKVKVKVNKLTIKDLSVNYGNVDALKSIDLQLPPSQIVALIGANGAGKTTTLKAVSGFLDFKGTIHHNGKNIRGKAPHELVANGLIHCPEGRGIFPNLTVYENLQLGVSGRQEALQCFKENLDHALELFPRLKQRLQQMAGTLSGGEQQMLALSRSLIAMPDVLLLDEPSLGLAPQIVKLIFEIIVKINKESKVSVLLVEQNAKQALKISDYAYVLEAGVVSLHGKAAHLLEDDRVRKIYLGEGEVTRTSRN
ncbi:MAG: ABC transporter ATP-binding protein [Oligoflexia bacterium]|nr:ABC transporter ATP-binding protein [Oligoflexia bacterium]MBF0366821.1 ABC transporter ATP-binding protein [Oligoflexia bacterium]